MHRTAHINEYSTRYSKAIDAAQTTKPNEWRIQAKNNKQGSSGECLSSEFGLVLSQKEGDFLKMARELYEERLSLGVAREQARKDLPLSTYTEVYWKCDAHNIFNFLALRKALDAQLEIREYANTLGDICKLWLPMSYKAFLNYRFSAMRLSALEVYIISFMSSPQFDIDTLRFILTNERLLIITGRQKNDDPIYKPKRELLQIQAKFSQLGIKLEW